MLSRVLGMARDICYSTFFGATALGDAWIIAFRIPNLSRRIFGEGAATSSFIPVYSKELACDEASAARLANTVTTVIFTLLSALVVVGWVILWYLYSASSATEDTKLIAELAAVMLPYAAIICTVAILAGVLNVHNHFAAPAAAPVLLNCFIIAAIVISGRFAGLSPKAQAFTAAVSVLVAGIAQTLLQLVVLKHKGIHIRPAWDVHSDAAKKVLMLMAPMVLGAAVTQINTLSDEVIAWIFSASVDKGDAFTALGRVVEYPLRRGSVMHLYLSQRLYQLPLGVFGISIATAIFPLLSRSAAAGDSAKMVRSLNKGLKLAVFIALPCSAGLIITAKPLIALMFEHGEKFAAADTLKCAGVLAAYALGITGYFLQQILVKAFYALHESKVPARSAMWAVALNVLLNLALIWPLGAAGLAAATAICSYVQVLTLMRVLRRQYCDAGSGLLRLLSKTLVASLIMLVAGFIFQGAIASISGTIALNLANILLTIALCGSLFLLTAKLTGNEGLTMLKR
jgi:putative peptidoglycan lipid II flippase